MREREEILVNRKRQPEVIKGRDGGGLSAIESIAGRGGSGGRVDGAVVLRGSKREGYVPAEQMCMEKERLTSPNVLSEFNFGYVCLVGAFLRKTRTWGS